MKHQTAVDVGTTKRESIDDTVRELKELEAMLRRQGMVTPAKTCANALKIINRYRDALKAGM